MLRTNRSDEEIIIANYNHQEEQKNVTDAILEESHIA